MVQIIKTLLGGRLARKASELVGNNPLLQIGAAGLATRLVTRSLPFGIVLLGATAAYEYHRRSKLTKRSATRKVRKPAASVA